jgi:hypothetical protein
LAYFLIVIGWLFGVVMGVSSGIADLPHCTQCELVAVHSRRVRAPFLSLLQKGCPVLGRLLENPHKTAGIAWPIWARHAILNVNSVIVVS